MAAVRSCTTGLLPPNFTTSTPLPRRIPLRRICSGPTPTPRKLANRKNYLRQKLLKTLTKPYPNSLTIELPQTNPAVPIELKQEQVLVEQFPADSCSAATGEELEMQAFREAEVQEHVKLMDNRIGKVSKYSIFRYGLWLVAAFVFQTICAVWVFGSAEFEDKTENMFSKDDKNSVLEVDANGKGKSKVKFLRNTKLGTENGGIVYVNEEEMSKQIEEIQVMAREARARERLEREVNGFDSGDSGGEDEFGQSGIEKEVNDRLAKVRRRYEYTRGTLPVGSVDYLKENGASDKNNLEGQDSMDDVRKDGVSVKKSLGGKEGKESLMSKKKYRFRGLSSKPSDKPKGFTGSADHDISKEVTSNEDGRGEVLMNGGIGGDVADLLVDVHEQDLRPSDFRASMSIHLADGGERKLALEAPIFQGTAEENKFMKEKDRREQEEEVDFLKSESDGLAQEKNQGKPLTTTVISRKSNILEKIDLSDEHDVLNKNGNMKSRGTENYQSASKIGLKNPESETDCWWLRLPYVLVILMQRRLDGNGVEQCLFTLSSSYAENDTSHAVAFEDRCDATNFCYLVQSFFEDLEHFTAEIVPLSVKELEERVKSHTWKVIVVKKGQLKLYAGQPLPDVEMALRSLVGQS